MKTLDYDSLENAFYRLHRSVVVLSSVTRALSSLYPEGLHAAMSAEQRAEIFDMATAISTAIRNVDEALKAKEEAHEQAESGNG